MRLIRVGMPALVGALLLFIAVQTTRSGLGDDGGSAVQAYRAGLLPAAIGVALLLSSLAIARRSRAGYLLGLAVAVLMVVAGLALIAIELPYLGDSDLSGAFATGFIVVAVVWGLLWAAYGVAFRRARASFASTVDPGDRRLAVVLAALAVFATVSYTTLGVVAANDASVAAVDEARAQELVNGTSVEVDVVDVATDAASSTVPGSPAVARLTLDLRIRSATPYLLATAPTLCLVETATYRDPAYKPDGYCWGSPSPSDALRRAFSDVTVPGLRTVRLELERGSSPCAFAAGGWTAELRLAPQLNDPGGGIGPAPAIYSITTVFSVESATVVPREGAASGSNCLASTVSP